MNVAGNYMAEGGYLGAPTNGMFTNQFAMGGEPDEPVTIFNINGKVMPMTLSQALENKTILQMFAPDEVDFDEDGDIVPEDLEIVQKAVIDHFKMTTDPVYRRQAEQAALEGAVAAEGVGTTPPVTPAEGLPPRQEGETDEQYISRLLAMNTSADKKLGLETMKANPLVAAATALPAIYNIGRGIFGKADELDVKDYQSRAKISPYEMNVDPQVAAAQRAYATSIQAAKNAAPGAGSYLATLGNMANMRQQSVRDIYAQKENFDNAQKMEADKFNAQVESGNMAQDLAIQQYNAQAKAAKQNMLATGLGQIATAAEGLSSQDLQEQYLKMVAPNFAGNFEYLTILEQAARAKANKDKEKSK
jgi:hypothetical protein